MRKVNKICTSLLLAAAFVFGACGKTGATENYAEVGDVEFWSCYATEKVLRDEVSLYDDIKQAPVINVEAIKGETESAQIIMTTGKKAVKGYDVSVTDLVCGDKTFAAENITVYHEKYVRILTATEYYTTSGYYPDCLAPFENVKGVGENNVAKNNNQGLYIGFNVPENQPEGIYKGSIKIKIGSGEKSVPVTLKIGNTGITSETHVLSSFLNEWYMSRAELDTSHEMYDKYNKFLFKYRVGCNNLIYRSNHTDGEILHYADIAAEYAALKECNGYNIPLVTAAVKDYDMDGELVTANTAYNQALLEKYLYAIAVAGVKNGVDTFKKAFLYGHDEPDLNGVGEASIKVSAYIVKQAKLNTIEKLRTDGNVKQGELLESIIDSMLKAPHVITSSSFMAIDFDLDKYDMVYCPEFQFIENKSQQDRYRLSPDNQLWWYGCVNPDYPYPTYHIDDTLISARVLSWMQADYDIQGNLYWATNSWSGGFDGVNYYTYLEEYYETVAGDNGEGRLLYPGKKYNVDGPLASVRMEAIRDGLEEYEIILKLKETYKNLSAEYGVRFDADKVLTRLYDSMYSGTRVNTTDAVFAANRARLLGLINLAASEYGVCVSDVREAAGDYVFTVIAKNGCELKTAGNPRTQTADVNGGKAYTYTVTPGELSSFGFTVGTAGGEYGFDLEIGSSSTQYNAEYLLQNSVVKRKNIAFTQSLVNAAEVNADETDGKYLKLDFEKATAQYEQSFMLQDNETIKKLNAGSDKLLIRIYNPYNESITYKLGVEYGNELGIYNMMRTDELLPGMNTIAINNLYGFKWSKLKYINSIRITLGSRGDAERTVYVADMSVYNK